MSPRPAADALRTRATARLGVTYPIVQAGMGYVARHELVAAVSRAGGLGVVGSTGDLTPGGLRDEIRAVKQGTDRPFAVNLLFPRYDDSPAGRAMAADLRDKVDVVLAEGVGVLGSGLGVPDAAVLGACRKAGIVTMATIGEVRHAVKAEAAGVDLVVAQGWEAGGHNSRVASMALVPQVAAAVALPVLAAGGIASGAGLVAALALGASGGYLGTVFAACREARAHPAFKAAVLAADATGTVVSRAYSGKPARLLANGFTAHYEQHPEEVEPFPRQWAKNEHTLVDACLDGHLDAGPLPAGQIAGLLTEEESAAEIVDRVVTEAIEILTNGLWSR